MKAHQIGVSVNGSVVEVIMVGGDALDVELTFEMTPVSARRHAMRVLQACEQAEGRHGVSP